jgi:hypothetical protein
MRIVLVPLLLVSTCAPLLGQAAAPTPDRRFSDRLAASRSTLSLGAGSFSGSGAAVLDEALAHAKYVLIGEDHGTREIAEFTSIVCDRLGPVGLSAYAVEAGPLGASMVSDTLQAPERLQREAALQQKYLDSVAFLNLRQENDLAAHCRASAKGDFAFWGLDQELMGAAGLIFDRILSTPLSQAAKAAVEALVGEEKADTQKALQTGDPSQLFVLAASDAELENARQLIHASGSGEARRLIDQLIESHQIYFKDQHGLPGSNRQRALLMKANLQNDLGRANDSVRSGKMLFKFGDWHLYKGLNPLLQLDLGNFIAEKADGEGAQSLHIIILGAKGSHLGFAGYGKPYAAQDFELVKDDDYAFMKPFLDSPITDGWSLYDLRNLRHTAVGKLSNDMERLIYGYDLLVVIPKVNASEQIH